ncbi:MAG TPA: cobalt ECF transporter T component CbiQ [Candidatus Krumholzibacteriaceae bacterium]|nr:cobalt ECF transporter T component CbiQ [Candidatus Krumholzibacteriaceae bacterium]
MKIGSARDDALYMEELSQKDTPVHRIDPRAKIIVNIFFIFTVLSFNRYEISALVTFFTFPLFLMVSGDLPAGYLTKKLLLISPIVVLIAVFNPVFDRETAFILAGAEISAGWVSFFSILIRFFLTAGSILILIASTGFYKVCMALERIGVPSLFVMQLLFLYRYIFVLLDEGARMVRAHALRSFSDRGIKIKTFGSLLGNLLLRTVDRADRIHSAMLARGFDGSVTLNRRIKFRTSDAFFVVFWPVLFILMRRYNFSELIGSFFLRIF